MNHNYWSTHYDNYLHNLLEQRLVKLPFDDFFMALAILATTRSQLKDEKKVSQEIFDVNNIAMQLWVPSNIILQVGACVVSENPRRALTVGYNGLPNGHTDSDALHDDKNGTSIFWIWKKRLLVLS